jgi:DNA-binding MarR family transcriptional regulator
MSNDWKVHDRMGILISTIARLSRTRFEKAVVELGLTRPQWRTLNCIRYQEGINQSQLAEMLEVEQMTVTRQIDNLEALGWVERRADTNDRRSRKLYLTRKVNSMLDRINAMVDELHDEAYANISGRDLAQLEKTLLKIHRNLVAALGDVNAALIEENKTPAKKRRLPKAS